jgi:hypothetical protein
MDKAAKPPSANHNNVDLLVWACYKAGGFEKWIDVEELYLKAFELGPARLSWRTRPDLPDYKKCAKALQELEDPKRSDHLGLFLKNGRYLRKLSDSGLAWCTTNATLLEKLYGSGQVRPQLNSETSRIVALVERSMAFRHFETTGIEGLEIWMIAEAIQCLPDSSPAVWAASFDRVQAAGVACGREAVGDFVRSARAFVAKEGGGL